MQTMIIDSMGKGGGTSSGNWHIHWHTTKLDHQGRPYTAHITDSFFTKRAMLAWLNSLERWESAKIEGVTA